MTTYSILGDSPKPSSEEISAATRAWPDLSKNPDLLTLIYLSYEGDSPHAALFVRLEDGFAHLFFATSGQNPKATVNNAEHHLITRLSNEANLVAKKLGVSAFRIRANKDKLVLADRLIDNGWKYLEKADYYIEMELVVGV